MTPDTLLLLHPEAVTENVNASRRVFSQVPRASLPSETSPLISSYFFPRVVKKARILSVALVTCLSVCLCHTFRRLAPVLIISLSSPSPLPAQFLSPTG